MDEIVSQAKASRGYVSLHTILRTRLCLGYYYEASTTTMRVLARLYCICFAYATIIGIFNNIDYIDHIEAKSFFYYMIPSIIEYATHVFVSFVTGDTGFFNFCKVIDQADREMGYSYLPLMTNPVKIVFISIIAIRVTNSFVFLITVLNLDEFPMWISVTLITLALNLSCIINILSLDLLRHRLALLRDFFELNLKWHNGSRMITNYQIETINNCLKLYRALIVSLNSTFSWAKLQIVVSFVCAFAFILLNGHDTVRKFKKNGENQWLACVISATTCIGQCVLASLPAIFAQRVSKEVDKLKISVGNKLLNCDDQELRAALDHAAVYLELRPFQITIWRVFPLDLSLVLSFAGLCTTYLIVIIQITGLV